MSAMLTSDATFSMEMFPFGHCLEGNGDVSSVWICHKKDKNEANGQNQAREWKEREKSRPKAYASLMGQPLLLDDKPKREGLIGLYQLVSNKLELVDKLFRAILVLVLSKGPMLILSYASLYV
ncbi:hypothetical protein Tco_0954368 [Tanacetum coccineum]|uniref:Uncharacterized protein n=1 Tax=Tanacetum coccineum TaxID=301880 RepID=A0ABQ5E2T3_9ASTR